MKKISLFILTLIMLASCGSGDDNDTPSNTAPTTPSLSAPANNLVCINNVVQFQWGSAVDAQNDAITYQLDIATDVDFKKNLLSSTTNLLSKEVTLEAGKLYYWRVKAIDSKSNSSSFTAAYTFYTEFKVVANHVPFAPQLVAPVLDADITTSSATLSWTAADADQDSLVYDVYLGTTNQPTQKVATDLTATTFTANSLVATSKYYWYVVVKDGKGGNTIGQIWSFKKQ